MERKVASILGLFALVVVLFAAAVLAQFPSGFTTTPSRNGCCCNLSLERAQVDSYLPSADCQLGFRDFVEPTVDDVSQNRSCSIICGARAALPPPVGAECGAPGFTPPPRDFLLQPVVGKRQFNLTWTSVCPADAYVVSRCVGAACVPSEQIAVVGSPGFIDADPLLQFGKEYTYSVVARYTSQGDSEQVVRSADLGDLECIGQTHDGIFCVSEAYYEQYRDYLVKFGFARTDAKAFSASFPDAVKSAFFSQFNRAFRCHTELPNRLVELTSCRAGTVCVAGSVQADCIVPSDCGLAGFGFGLGTTVSLCEGSQAARKYCFYDRSATAADKCYACTSRLSCVDYRSRGACERDNCGAGSCEWRDVFPRLGIGVCVDTRIDNCPLCGQRGSVGASNAESYNEVFDRCSPERASALSLPGSRCFARDDGTASSCAGVGCIDYKRATDCVGPGVDITRTVRRDSDNNLVEGSDDPCGLQVCQWDDAIQCHKNQNGRDEPDTRNWPDCPFGDVGCERDTYAPVSSIVPTLAKGRPRYLNVVIQDKRNGTDTGVFIGNAKSSRTTNSSMLDTRRPLGGYALFFCVSPATAAPCTNYAVRVNSTLLTINDLKVLDGTVQLATLSDGLNRLRYFAQDPARNIEVVKEVTIVACTACQGPDAELTFFDARLLNGTWFTRSRAPRARVLFDEPASITASGITSGNLSLPVSATPSAGFASSYSLQAPSLEDGVYILGLNARDAGGVLMDTPIVQRFIVDNTPPTASYLPAAGSTFIEPSAGVVIRLSEPGVLLNVTIFEDTLVELAPDVWVRRSLPRDVTSLFTTMDNTTFRANLSLDDGQKQLVVDAEDVAGNKLVASSRSHVFSVDAGPPVISLRSPPYGFSSQFIFPLSFETDSPATCRFWADPLLPPLASFEDWERFDATGSLVHTKNNFNRITLPGVPFSVNVWCRDGQQRETSSLFRLQVDQTVPEIVAAYASPNPVVQLPLVTKLTVQTDDLSFCRYSASSPTFALMESVFPGFNISGTRTHSVNLTLPAPRAARYYVGCINLALLGPVSAPVTITVDLSQPLMIDTTNLPRVSGKTLIPIGVETNKDTVCVYSFRGSTATFDSDVDGVPKLSHSATLVVPGSGTYAVDVTCYTGTTTTPSGVQRASASVNITVDTTAPYMEYVDDTSELPEDPEVTWRIDELQVNWMGRDDETSVTRYFYTIEELATREVVVNSTPYGVVNGSPFRIRGLNLTDGRTYLFKVRPENAVGLLGNESRSDGVTVDVSKRPALCSNGVKDENETGVDCGRSCAGCADGVACSSSTDCLSGYCKDGICAPSSCSDSVRNGKESGVDCGGSCAGCPTGGYCVVDTDCASGYCEAGTCAARLACENGRADGQESDVDCGGSCSVKCGDGLACFTSSDCVSGLRCDAGRCTSRAADDDGDGVLNADDKCPGTPRGEAPDASGCSASQRKSCGDAITDLWRTRYFGDVQCSGDGAPDADPDGDGVTNIEEYNYYIQYGREIDPTLDDTDDDGWSDGKEIARGTDPTDPSDRPSSSWLWWLLLLVLLLLAALGGYLAYQYYKHKEESHRPLVIARKPLQPPRIAPRQPVHLEDLASKVKPQDVGKDVFSKLQQLNRGDLSSKEHEAIEKDLHSKPDVFDKLRATAWQGFSAKERKDLLLKLQLYRKGKLSREEIEELFRKLRITAAYYKANRADLERELAEYGQRKPRARRRR